MEDKILDILVELCDDESLRENRDIELFESDLLDSLAFAELILSIEEEFDLIISPSELERKDIDTPNKIIGLIKSRLG